MNKIISVFVTSIMIFGCSKKDDFSIKLVDDSKPSKKFELSIDKGKGQFIIGQTKYSITVLAASANKSFEVQENESGYKFDFNYQKDTNTWVCATCTLFERPVHWKKAER